MTPDAGLRGTHGVSSSRDGYPEQPGLILMVHDRERDRTEPDVEREPESKPVLFVLEAMHRGEPRIVAQGIAFTDPETVVINWRASSSVEIVDSVDELYEKFGTHPRVLWEHESGVLTEAEPDRLVQAETEDES